MKTGDCDGITLDVAVCRHPAGRLDFGDTAGGLLLNTYRLLEFGLGHQPDNGSDHYVISPPFGSRSMVRGGILP